MERDLFSKDFSGRLTGFRMMNSRMIWIVLSLAVLQTTWPTQGAEDEPSRRFTPADVFQL
jgi:hypothetical protein